LLQWAVGGMAFCWFTTRRREVGVGYGWLLRGTYLLLGAGALLAAWRYDWVPGRDVASMLFVAGCAVALIVSIVVGGSLWTAGGGDEASILARTGEDSLMSGSVLGVADQLFNEHLLPFEVASLLLLVAIVGAVALTKRRL